MFDLEVKILSALKEIVPDRISESGVIKAALPGLKKCTLMLTNTRLHTNFLVLFCTKIHLVLVMVSHTPIKACKNACSKHSFNLPPKQLHCSASITLPKLSKLVVKKSTNRTFMI